MLHALFVGRKRITVYMDWVKTLNDALDYIEDNLLEDITSLNIAKHVYVSNAHLQRGFYYMTGLTLGEYIRNRRLTLAGHELSAKGAKVIDAAVKYGFETSESFSKAFSRFHGVTPAQAKRRGVNLKSYNRLTAKIIMEGGSVMDYRIEKKEAFSVIVKAKTFGENGAAEIPAFWDEYLSSGAGASVAPMMGVCGDVNPDNKEFWYGIGSPAENTAPIPDGFVKWDIPENSWAIFKCVGAMPDAIQTMWKRIYSEWLPQANYELIPSYDIEYYTEGDTSSPDYISEIWAPVKEK